MRLLVVGCTGGTGRALLRQALERGHQVVGVARDVAGLAEHPRLRLVAGDVREPHTLAAALEGGCDAVLSALGTHARTGVTDVYSAGTRAVVDAMRAHGVTRLVCISAAGVDDPAAVPRFFRWVVLPLFARVEYADMARMEAEVERSDLEWTIVRPLWLRSGPARGSYRTSDEALPAGGTRIRRADLAALMLEAVEMGRWVCRRVWVAY